MNAVDRIEKQPAEAELINLEEYRRRRRRVEPQTARVPTVPTATVWVWWVPVWLC